RTGDVQRLARDHRNQAELPGVIGAVVGPRTLCLHKRRDTALLGRNEVFRGGNRSQQKQNRKELFRLHRELRLQSASHISHEPELPESVFRRPGAKVRASMPVAAWIVFAACAGATLTISTATPVFALGYAVVIFLCALWVTLRSRDWLVLLGGELRDEAWCWL